MPNFCARILDAAARFPERPAIEFLGARGVETTTYRGLATLAGQVAAWLVDARLGTGDRAALLADNSAAWVAAYLGTLWIGGVAVPLDTAYKPDQIRAIVASSGARLLFTTPRYLDRARTACAALGADAPQVVLLSGASPGLSDLGAIGAAAATPPPIVPFETAEAAPAAPADRRQAPAAVMLYTSGTTADPKGVVLTHANLDAERAAALAVVDATEGDAVLGVLPLFHALAQMANLLLPLSVGARVVFLETVSSSSLLEALGARGITIFACVPQFFYLIHERIAADVARGGRLRRLAFRLLRTTNASLRDRVGWNPGRRWFGSIHRRLGPRMRWLITGGSRFDETIARDLHALGFTILNAYGLTETSGGATLQRPKDRFTTSVGPPLPGVEIRIARSHLPTRPDATGEGTTFDESSERRDDEGEILIRGAIVMREYFGRPDATDAAIDAEGFLHTGDLGRCDRDGRLYITGRLKELIVLSSGKNLYPEEIEAHYRQSAFIKELCVMGLTRPDAPAAERLHAVVLPNDETLRARGIVNVGDIIRFEIETWSASLPPHKRILSYDIAREALPRTTTGKLKRPEIEREARARAARAATREAGPPLPPTEAERTWLASPGRADLTAAIAASLDRPRVRADDNLELDLGLDSMERVELVTTLERRAGTMVSAGARATIFTVRQLVDAVISADRRGEATTEGATADEPPWRAILDAPPDPVLVREFTKSKTIVALGFLLVIRAIALAARVAIRIRVRGREHLPGAGPFLITPNHQTFVDGFLLAGVLPFRTLRQLFFVGAAEFFETPGRRRFAALINLVPVDPDAHLVRAMQAGATGLRLGKVLILFPEGERSIDGTVKRFRKGAAILASHLGVPLVPVAVDGLFPLWPRGRAFQWRLVRPWRPWARPVVTVAFGEPMRATNGQILQDTAALERAVRDLWTAAHRT